MKNQTLKENLEDSDFSFIGVVTVLIAYLTTRLIVATVKEVIVLSLDVILFIQLVTYFSIIVLVLKYYYNKKYEGVS